MYFNPWERISTPAGLRAMLIEAGVVEPDIVAEQGNHGLNCPDDWWLIAIGSGYRGTITQLDATTVARVRERNLASLGQCDSIATNVVYRLAFK